MSLRYNKWTLRNGGPFFMKEKPMKKQKVVISKKRHPRCIVQKKAMYTTEKEAGYAMRRAWSHDPSMDMTDIHVYKCPNCGFWHFGHISYYKKYLQSIPTGT